MTDLPPTPILIGLGGYYQSGKDAAADVLEDMGFARCGMSDILDAWLIRQDPWIRIQRGEPEHDGSTWLNWMRYSDLRSRIGYVEAKKISDVRRILQTTGTEAGRFLIHEDVWTTLARESAGARAQRAWRAGRSFAITGIRYPNELAMIHDMGGTTVWIERPSATERHRAQSEQAGAHSSENSLAAEDFDHVLVNDGTLDDLGTLVHLLVAALQVVKERGR